MPATPAPTPTPAIYCRSGTLQAFATPSPTSPPAPGDVVVTVLVNLDAAGKPTAVSVQRSSGNFAMDAAAKRAAMESTYVPKLVPVPSHAPGVVCGAGVPSTYLYTITFSPER